jgi:hypothetical protein
MAMPHPTKTEAKVIGYLVELDAILDTRLALMDTLDPEAAVKLIQSPAYFKRQVDKFEAICGMDDQIYQEAWKTRTKDVLKRAINTPTIDLVHYMLIEVENLALTDPMIAGARLDINVYPYKLTQAERDGIAWAIAHRAGWRSRIRVLDQPPIYFTPAIVRHDYQVMVMYNHNAWLEAQSSELFASEVGLPGVTLYAPRLAKDEMPPKESYDLRKYGVKHEFDIFEAVAHAVTQYITLEYLPIDQYCIAWPGINGPQPAKTPEPTPAPTVEPTEVPAA